MALNRGVRRRVLACALGCFAILVASGCSSPPPKPPRPTSSVAPVRLLIAPPQVVALAGTFVDQFVARDYGLQWDELAPQAQAAWPSAAARTAMLARKFAHAA